MRESGGVRTAWLNLDNIVKCAFSDGDRSLTFDALASAVMHGRHARGWDIAVNPETWRTEARSIGLLILERICNYGEEMNHLAATLRQFVRLDHAAGFGGTFAATTDAMAQQALGRIDRVLVPGVDYAGEGTAESPFQFGPHLQLHQASRALIEQLGIDFASCSRVLERSVVGSWCERWKTPSRDYWIQVDLPGIPRGSDENSLR